MNIHLKIGGAVFLCVLAWSTWQAVSKPASDGVMDVQFAIEHTQPASIGITRSIGGEEHFIDISNTNEEIIFVSLPEAWQRDEVRNVPLASLTADEPSLGYARWHLPPSASVTFESPNEWDDLTIHNPSGIVLQVQVTTVDLRTHKTTEDVYLVQEDDLTIPF